ncbi:universal stress protein [Sneathiella chinensis]|uniref:UspA domain-containing protein n=1 Tax=Sneathiella chinensis TaxID=349750 RepID=A0ABQ5U413_9PROT|nr:universal stress protein [Sneathiella chinensis]GLQ06478.1 hypothetical protein GCM10007924_16990 [Sneathiella chinensis]
MPYNYIVGFDGTDQSRRAVDYAAAQAEKSGAELHLVFVIEWSPYSFHTAAELAERKGRRVQELKRAEEIVLPLAEELKARGVVSHAVARHGNAVEVLCSLAKEKETAQIIIGRTGDTALTQRLLGGLAISLAQASPVPLTIVP